MLGLVGISYKSAPLEIREQYSFTDAESLDFLKQLKLDLDLKGAIVLSTCNRIEVYFHIEKCCNSQSFDFIYRNIEYYFRQSTTERKHFYQKEGADATRHLFAVISGIESLIIGEDQIVTQVKNAFRISLDNDMSSPVLTRMFNKAFEAGKRVRSETSINEGTASISSAAVDLICNKTSDLPEKNILIIGAGVMGELALANLVKKECKNIFVTNRTYEKAEELGHKHNLKSFKFDKITQYIPQSDVIIVATGAPNHIITRQMVDKCCKKSKRKQLYMDLSVPRNISTDTGERENTELFAVDDLQEIVKETKNKRMESISEAHAIIEMVLHEFNDWLCSLNLTPAIMKIKKNFEKINATELEGFLRNNGIQNDEMVARYANHISAKYSRLLIKNLKNVTNNGKDNDYLEKLDQLFELADE